VLLEAHSTNTGGGDGRVAHQSKIVDIGLLCRRRPPDEEVGILLQKLRIVEVVHAEVSRIFLLEAREEQINSVLCDACQSSFILATSPTASSHQSCQSTAACPCTQIQDSSIGWANCGDEFGEEIGVLFGIGTPRHLLAIATLVEKPPAFSLNKQSA
jgi:hypothetical protein